MIKSISYNQEEIIKNIQLLYTGDIECDPTYSKGNFYRNINKPKHKFDINPQSEGVRYADCRRLPLKDNSIKSIMFDPPFLATKGISLNGEKGNIIANRFGVYPTEKELHQFYIDSMKEFYRILEDKGWLVFKCQDKVSSGKQYLSHVFVVNQAISIGFYPKDIFILVAKNRLTPEWQTKNQKHARKYHSYFLVFQKNGGKIAYI